MSKNLMRLCSWIVTIALMINMLPVHVWATEIESSEGINPVETATPIAKEADSVNEDTEAAEDAEILEENVENRTEFSKDYQLINGLHMAVVYPDAVHFEEAGEWKEIDNTLKLSENRAGKVYTNTAGKWQVSFPQNLTGDKSVTITEDGYTVSFAMVGQLRNTGHAVMKADEELTLDEAEPVPDEIATVPVTEETIASDVQITIPTEETAPQESVPAETEIAAEATAAPAEDTGPSVPPEEEVTQESTAATEVETIPATEETTGTVGQDTIPTEEAAAQESAPAEVEIEEGVTEPPVEDTVPSLLTSIRRQPLHIWR